MQSAANLGLLTVYLADNDVTPYIIGCFGTVMTMTGNVAVAHDG